jgi:hypothetical protein
MKKILIAFVLGTVMAAGVASAQTTFQAFLLGINEVPPNASPASGFGQVVLNAAQTQITVDENWSGLVSPATASHIHGFAGVGTNAAVLFPFSGVPAATAGAIPQQVFAITAAQVAQLFAGNMYMNIHTSVFPGGEIRGQLAPVPEPGTLALAGVGAASLGLLARRKTRATKK